jgi:ABC-type multidrug transport system fused ATPase/permease subunit
MLDGFALHKIITDKKGKPIDYEFIEVNSAFEKMTGLKRDILIGKRVTKTLPGIEKDPADWIGKYGDVALTQKDIRFDSVDYSYVDNKKIFSKVNLVINKNDFVGIIGPSGSGKTTLINLLCGLLPPSSGSILVDSKNIKNNINSWRKKIAYVPQKIFLIDDTVAANIALGIEDYSLKKVNNLIYESNFSKFIEELPDGVNTKIGEDGNKLSIGQKQRLNILRALYHNPEILIFDEASSALDQKNEEIFLNLIMEFKSKKTVFFITHKLKLLKSFDKIYEIKDKQIFQL